MKYLADTHMHSIYSYDGQMTLEKMVERGLKLGLQYMAFSEHLELDQITIQQFLNRYKLYSEELEKLQEKYPTIKLIKAVEFSNPEKYQKELEYVNNLDIDLIIGSNHILPTTANEKEILTYYKRILTIVKQGGIDVLAHIDYIRRKYDDHNVSKDIIKEIYRSMLKNDITLEINSSATRRKNLDSFPSSEKIELYVNEGGSKITIGSDAHRLSEIYDNIETIDNKYDLNKGVYIKRKFISLSEK